MRTIILIFFVFISIWCASVNTAKLVFKNSIPWWSFTIMSIGLTGVLTYFLGLW